MVESTTVNGRMTRKQEKVTQDLDAKQDCIYSQTVGDTKGKQPKELLTEKVALCIILGSYYFPNGERYEGEWNGGMMNGHGIFVFNFRNLLL